MADTAAEEEGRRVVAALQAELGEVAHIRAEMDRTLGAA